MRPGVLPPSRPDFLTDRENWRTAWDYAVRIGAELPLAVALRPLAWFEEIPEPARLRVEERLARARVLLAVCDEEIERALFPLIQARVPVMVGGALALGRRYYAERLARPVEVADLLVPPESMTEALRALGRAGYRAGGRPGELSRGSEGHGTIRMQRFLRPGDSEELTGEVWQRSIERAFADLPPPVRAMHAEDHFVHCVRELAVGGDPAAPVLLNDLHFVVRSAEFQSGADWERLLWTLARHRALAATWVALRMLTLAWGTAVPREASSALDARLGGARLRALGAVARPRPPGSVQGLGRFALRYLQSV